MSKKENRTYSRRIRSSYITSIISISLVLLLLGMVGLLLINGRNIRKQVMESIGFNVILKENVKEADIYQLQKILDSREFILSTEYVTKEEAALETEFYSLFGLQSPTPFHQGQVASAMGKSRFSHDH